MLSILMGVTFDRVLKETSGQTKVNITALMNSEFQRDLFVDNNMLIHDFKEPMYQDAYAIILGANLLYKEENKFQSYNHILK